MILKVYSVYDTKAHLWMQPFFLAAHGQAVRAFSDEANSPQSQLGRHPNDFILFCIGEFDDNSAVLAPTIPPLQLGVAADFVAPKAPANGSLFDGPMAIHTSTAQKGV